MNESTVKDEFFYPVYDKPVVIKNDVNGHYAAVGIPRRYYDMDLSGYVNMAASLKKIQKHML